ncbi:MAG: pyruvate dehydrogenase (acetyl-transferring) E1 component subunit alpha [Enhygromyxa sp.]
MKIEALTREIGRELLAQMLRIRRFEEAAAEQYSAGKIRGFLHLYIGEEAIAVGAIRALAADEAVVSTYREHGHALVKGISARAIMAEMFGKLEGCARGRGGSMHLFDAATRFYGGNAIVAAGLPLAGGLALGDKMQGRARVTACFFGDGATAEGEFHEALNLAALWELPVLFACENNLYAMGTALERYFAQPDLCLKAQACGVPAVSVDGNDLLAVAEASEAACQRIRAGGGPEFIEFRTYRLRGHSMFDTQLYRDKREVEEWTPREPIVRFEAKLRELGLLDDAELAAIEAEIAAEVADAIAFAEAGTLEPVEELTRFVYSEAPR